jgi:hypothetical protein
MRRAFQFIASNTKKRAARAARAPTDLVDKESSKELITSLKLLRPPKRTEDCAHRRP